MVDGIYSNLNLVNDVTNKMNMCYGIVVHFNVITMHFPINLSALGILNLFTIIVLREDFVSKKVRDCTKDQGYQKIILYKTFIIVV